MSQIWKKKKKSKYEAVIFRALATDSVLATYCVVGRLLGNLGEFEGILCLCSDPPITLALSSFYLSIIQIWPPGKGEWESNRPALFKLTNKGIKWSGISAHTPVMPETDNTAVESWPQSVSAVWFKQCLNFNKWMIWMPWRPSDSNVNKLTTLVVGLSVIVLQHCLRFLFWFM